MYSRHNWPSNDRSVSHLTQSLLLHYLGKTEQTKFALKLTKNIFPDMWPPTANQLQGLTVVQQHVH